jgi:histidyl-tRNA synthetase
MPPVRSRQTPRAPQGVIEVAGEIQAIRGMNDVLPAEIGAWQHFETQTRALLAAYGYEEIRVPILEHTELFKRAIGEHTDVVGKEMYTFTDRGGDSLTLRPEATAGIARALISNGMLRGARHKLWCIGPMFRHETPQAGRYRQFWQVDVEAVGYAGPDIDAELIAFSARLWQRLGISGLRLEINSLGTPESRREYRARLIEYFRAHEGQLDEDSQRRLAGNPLRILDSKNPQMQDLIRAAPELTEHLDPESRAHFEELCAMLRAVGVPYEINPRLVRGLDYYSRTVFEWITKSTGAQNAVCSGGRYDGLIAQLGGEATPAIGFAMGVERLVALLVAAGQAPPAATPDVYVVVNGAHSAARALEIVERLRSERPRVRFELNLGGGNFKAQFRRADKSGAPLALIVGEDELARGVVAMKPLREQSGQSECPIAGLAAGVDAALAALAARQDQPSA